MDDNDAVYEVMDESLRLVKGQRDEALSVLRRIVDSGVLCDPGCCGDECACDDARRIVGVL